MPIALASNPELRPTICYSFFWRKSLCQRKDSLMSNLVRRQTNSLLSPSSLANCEFRRKTLYSTALSFNESPSRFFTHAYFSQTRFLFARDLRTEASILATSSRKFERLIFLKPDAMLSPYLSSRSFQEKVFPFVSQNVVVGDGNFPRWCVHDVGGNGITTQVSAQALHNLDALADGATKMFRSLH